MSTSICIDYSKQCSSGVGWTEGLMNYSPNELFHNQISTNHYLKDVTAVLNFYSIILDLFVLRMNTQHVLISLWQFQFILNDLLSW